MSRVSNETIAKRHGKTWADRLFNDFRDHPEYRGPKFDWHLSMDSFARLCSVSLFTNFKKAPRNIRELECVSRKHFTKRWKTLLANGVV